MIFKEGLKVWNQVTNISKISKPADTTRLLNLLKMLLRRALDRGTCLLAP